ncbi:acyl-protein synthase [Streptomyces sp. NPDC020719]|uniref:LuxE/PaaK family acyltransferase n=1 Tax=Streptomyces sp. NPDC020719 TaxID=3154896 RepID=UPI0033DF5102
MTNAMTHPTAASPGAAHLKYFAPLPVPDPGRLAHLQRLGDLRTPYATGPAVDDLFATALDEVNRWHIDNSPVYRDIWNGHSADRNAPIASADDAAGLPLVPATFFKSHEVLSIGRDEVAAHLTSSGTTGQKSQMFFDAWSIGSVMRMAAFVLDHYGFITPDQPNNYLLYSYEPTDALKLGTAFTDNFLCDLAPVNERAYALRAVGSEHVFDSFGSVDTLLRYAEQDLPVRILGFPSFLWFTLERMRAMGVGPLKLRADSFVYLGGGWKGQAGRQVSKFELYDRIEEQLGIPHERVRDSYGAVEHGVTYAECARHRLHAPVWSRIFARDVATLRPLPYGEQGYLHCVSPFMTSAPVHSLLMGDLVSVRPGSDCGCGLETPWFEIHGRAGTSTNRSCAVAAAELMKGAS